MQELHFPRTERSVERNRSRLTEFFSGSLIFSGYFFSRAPVPSDFANPLAKQAARIWQVPFAIEIPLPLETSDLNPSGICAADCRLIRMAVSPLGGRARWALFCPLLPSSSPFSPSRISLLLFHYSSFLPRALSSLGRSMWNFSWTVSGGERYPVKIRKANRGRQIRVSFGSPPGITEGFKRLAAFSPTAYSIAAPLHPKFEVQYARPQIFSKILIGIRRWDVFLSSCSSIIFLIR